MVSPGRPKVPDKTQTRIIKIFLLHTDWSLRRIARNVGGISHVTVMRVLRKNNLWISKNTGVGIYPGGLITNIDWETIQKWDDCFPRTSELKKKVK